MSAGPQVSQDAITKMQNEIQEHKNEIQEHKNEIQELKNEIQELKELIKELKESNKELKESNKELKESNKELKELNNNLIISHQKLTISHQEMATDLASTKALVSSIATTTAAPIVVMIIYKVMAKLLRNRSFTRRQVSGDKGDKEQLENLKKLGDRRGEYDLIGFPGPKMVDDWLNTWPVFAMARNAAAHEARGDDVVNLLPFIQLPAREYVKLAFPKIFGRKVEEWATATEEQRARVVYNCSEEELFTSG